MPNLKVSLLLRVITPEGKRAFLNPAVLANGKMRKGWAVYNEKPTEFENGVYYLRYKQGSRLVFECAGPELDAAQIAMRKKSVRLEAVALGELPPEEPKSQQATPSRLRLEEAIKKYLLGVEASRAPATVKSYRASLEKFRESCGKAYLDQLCREDAQGYIINMRAQGLAPHSMNYHLQVLDTFVRVMGRGRLLGPKEWPRYTPKPPLAYSIAELKRLLQFATPEEQLLFRFFVATGCRAKEVSHAFYSDVDHHQKVLVVQEKAALQFMPKSRKPRQVPLPDDLLESLRERQKQHPDQKLIFPNTKNAPNTHFLTLLKRLAHRASMNCGECCSGKKTCKTEPICRRWTLHSLRRSYCTLLHRAGTDARTLQQFLGHSSLLITQRYLASESATSPAAREAANSTFAALAPKPGPRLVASA